MQNCNITYLKERTFF